MSQRRSPCCEYIVENGSQNTVFYLELNLSFRKDIFGVIKLKHKLKVLVDRSKVWCHIMINRSLVFAELIHQNSEKQQLKFTEKPN